MANIRVKDLPNTSAPAADTDEFIIDSSSAGTRRLNYGELKTAISGDFQSGTTTYKVATLGSDNKLDPDQIPDTLSQGLNFVGVANSAGDFTSTTQGDFYVIQTAFGVYSVGDQAVYDGSAYVRVTDGTKEISEGGTGATTLDAAKVNLEIIDIGTAPNQCPTMGMLGSMSVQDAEAVSVGTVSADEIGVGVDTIEAPVHAKSSSGSSYVIRAQNSSGSDLGGLYDDSSGNGEFYLKDSAVATKVRLDSSGDSYFTGGRVGIGLSNPGDYNSATRDLVVGATTGNHGVSIVSGNSSAGALMFADSDSDTVARIQYNHASDLLKFRVAGGEKVEIDSSGNVNMLTGGIDFGSTNTASGVTVTGSVMSEYEVGTWTPSFTTSGSGFTTPPTMNVFNARYVRVGDLVTFTSYIETDAVDLTGAGTYLLLTGLPYAASASSGFNFSAVNVGFATRWANNPAGGYIQSATSFIYLTKRTSSVTGDFTEMSPSDLTAGTTADQNRLMISGSYVIA